MRPDVNKPVENPKLSSLFLELKSADDSRRPQIREAIAEEIALNAYLLAIIHMDESNSVHKDDGTFELKKGATIEFEMLKAGDTFFMPVFTDWNELLKCEEYQKRYKEYSLQTLIVSFDDMAAITAGQKGIAVNPYSDNFVIGPKDLVHMKEHKDMVTKGSAEMTITEDTKVLIGDPANYPTEMVEAIKKYAKKNKAIKAIWLKLMTRGDEQSHLAIVDFVGDRNAVFGGIAGAARPYFNGMYLDMVPYADSFGQQAATGEPFYRRKKGLFG